MKKKPERRWVRALVVNPKRKDFGRTWKIDPTAWGGRNPNPDSPHLTVMLQVNYLPHSYSFCISEIVLIDDQGVPHISKWVHRSEHNQALLAKLARKGEPKVASSVPTKVKGNKVSIAKVVKSRRKKKLYEEW